MNVKQLKVLMVTLILALSLFIIGESRMLKLEGFSDPFDTTTLYPNSKKSEKQMIADIYAAAERNQMDVFTYEETPNGSFSSTKTIYGTEGVEKHLANQQIRSETYDSVFLGDITFTFKPLYEHPRLAYTPNFYGIGSSDAVKAFKMDLIDTYAGNHPQLGYNEHTERNRVLGIWSLVIIITVLMTFYELSMNRKELLVRLSMGERLSLMIGKSIAFDSVIVLGIFAFSFGLLRQVTPLDPYWQFLLLLVFILLVCNGLVYLLIGRLQIKEAFANSYRSRTLLSMTYGLKFITALLTILMLSSTITVITEAVALYQQRDFFETKQTYDYTYIGHKITSPNYSDETSPALSEQIQTELYRRYQTDFSGTLVTPLANFSTRDQTALILNRQAFEEIKERLPEVTDVFTNKLTIIAPEQATPPSKEELDNTLQSLGLGPFIEQQYETIRYTTPLELTAIDQNLVSGSLLVDEPTLIVLNDDAKTRMKLKQLSSVLLSDIMYDVNPPTFDRFVEEQAMTDELFIRTNVWDKYIGAWETAKRLMNMNLIFAALIISLELLIIVTVLKLEYQVNALELSVKKVIGYSIWQKNRRLVLYTLGITSFSTLIVTLAVYFFAIGHPLWLLSGGGLLALLEGIVLVGLIRKIERANIQRILKGGNV